MSKEGVKDERATTHVAGEATVDGGARGQTKRSREADAEAGPPAELKREKTAVAPRTLREQLTAAAAAAGLPVASGAPNPRQQCNKMWAADFLRGKLEGPAPSLSPPTLVQELARRRESERLCAVLESACAKKGLRGPPKDGFVRWVFTRKMLEPPEQWHRGDGAEMFDPIFPSRGERDAGLEDELMKMGLSVADAVAILALLAKESRWSVDAVARTVAAGEAKTAVEVKKQKGDKAYELTFSGVSLHVTSVIWERLEKRYQNANRSEFVKDMWLLLCRYRSLTGEGYQGAVRREGLKYLYNRYQVKHECFASPLNAYLETFTSAFVDTDKVFGSLGSFFNLRETLRAKGQAGGSFEVNPPFVEEIMLATSLYLDMWLQDADPLSFFIFYPGWSDTPGFEVLKQSRFRRHLKFLPKRDHTYLPGYQHLPDREGHSIAYADSYIVVMQNDAGAQKWPVDEAGVAHLLQLLKNE
jgi:hypothetical protein